MMGKSDLTKALFIQNSQHVNLLCVELMIISVKKAEKFDLLKIKLLRCNVNLSQKYNK